MKLQLPSRNKNCPVGGLEIQTVNFCAHNPNNSNPPLKLPTGLRVVSDVTYAELVGWLSKGISDILIILFLVRKNSIEYGTPYILCIDVEVGGLRLLICS